MTYKCQSCHDEFDPEVMCIHFDDHKSHTWCSECCANFYQTMKVENK